jgi:hypothetical protein
MIKIQEKSLPNKRQHLSNHEGVEPKKHLFLIENDQNYGFAEGNNIGIRFAMNNFQSDYILLLNNDTVQDPCFLKNLVEGSDSCSNAGFAGPKIYYSDYKGRTDVINHAGVLLSMWTGIAIHRGDEKPDTGQYDQVREVDSLTGACLLVKREVIEKIGLLNPDYFLYWEETDWCLRGRKAGYVCVYIPSSIIWHHVGSSVQGPTYQYYYTRNLFWFIKENAERPQKIMFVFFFFLIDLWYNLFRMARQKNLHKNTLFAFFKGIKDGISQLPQD